MLYVLLSAIAGAMLPLEASTNGALGKRLSHPLHAAIVAFVVGLVALVIVSLAMTKAVPAPGRTLSAPAWTLLGGLYGAVFVTLAALCAPKTGSLTFVLAVLAGQVVIGAILDHFGILGNAVRMITPLRAVGIVLLIAGVYMVQKF